MIAHDQPAKTREEVEALKSNWYSDSCWDLEDTEGFEAHRDELLTYRKQVEGARAERRAKEHEAAIVGLIQPALDFLPEKDERGGLTRSDAARPGHAANRLLRAVAEMLLPIVERLERINEANDRAHEEFNHDLDNLREAVGAP